MLLFAGDRWRRRWLKNSSTVSRVPRDAAVNWWSTKPRQRLVGPLLRMMSIDAGANA